MHALHPALITELAHARIDHEVRTASRASVVGAARGASRRRLRVGRRAPRHAFPSGVA